VAPVGGADGASVGVGMVDEDGGAMTDLVTAVALMLVLEGVAWALAPDGMKRAAVLALATGNQQLRAAGLIAIAFGVFLVWLMRG
jgi:uncharacterized protein YjeT (DUF2065 family)